MFWLFAPPPPPPPPATLLEAWAETHEKLVEGFYPSLFVALCILNLAFNVYLSVRSRRRLVASTGVPEVVKRVFGDMVAEVEYEKTRQYSLAKNSFALCTLPVGLLTTALGLYTAPVVWNGPAKDAAAYFGYGADCEIARMMMMSLILAPIDQIFSLPMGAYRQLVLEEKFGFNNQTAGAWLLDALKSFIVELVISALSMAPLVWTLRGLGENAWFYGWLFLSLFVIIFNMAYPVLVMPLFNTFAPMEEGPVRSSIERLVETTKLDRAYKILVSDGSRQSSHSNAFVTGFFGVKRIVVYDTLLCARRAPDARADSASSVVYVPPPRPPSHHAPARRPAW